MDFHKLGERASDKMTNWVGSWTFVWIYTLSMIAWIILHEMGVLHIDSPDFIRFNLWLSYFAGIQASIVLMSAARAGQEDRVRRDEAFEIEKSTFQITTETDQRVLQLMKQITILETVVEALIKEKQEREI